MLDYLTLRDRDGVDVLFHHATTRAIAEAEGLVGIVGTRRTARPRPSGHGSIVRSKWARDRTIVLKGEVWGATQAAAFDQLDVIGAALEDARDQDRLLRYRRGGGGLELQTYVRFGEFRPPRLVGGKRFLTYEAELLAPDPRAYSQEMVAARSPGMGDSGGGFVTPLRVPITVRPSSAGRISYVNLGNAPTPPVFRIYGYVNEPVIRLGTGPEIVINGQVAEGDYLEVDVARRQVLLNGTVPRLSRRDFARTTLFELPRGSGQVRLLAQASSADAHLTVTYRHAHA